MRIEGAVAFVVCAILCECKSKTSVAPFNDAAAPPAPIASATPDAAHTIRRPAPRDVVERWNEAHVKHDAHALESVYASHVAFYGQTLTGRECAQRKGAAFAKDPKYTQSIQDVVTTSKDAGTSALTVIRFTKTSTSNGKSTAYPSTLVLDRSALIISESDDVTEANLAKMAAAAAAEWCTNNEPDIFDAIPNDKIIAPYTISARDAWRRAPSSKHFKDLVTQEHGDFLVLDVIECPTGCDRTARKCGYTMRVGNHGHVDEHWPWAVDWIYVDAIDGTVWHEEGTDWKSEPLPPLDPVWTK